VTFTRSQIPSLRIAAEKTGLLDEESMRAPRALKCRRASFFRTTME
jgi:hypothetical protein